VLAEQALYFFNYPIARSGVTLTIGPYQLLVADACSGLHSMFSLSAMGLLYLYLMRHTSTTRNLILIASILPIAFFANVMRVILLVLITYHLGDEAGQGFLHGFAGILLFVIGLLFLFLLDAFLGLFLKDKISPRSKAA
jgi:exosortase